MLISFSALVSLILSAKFSQWVPITLALLLVKIVFTSPRWSLVCKFPMKYHLIFEDPFFIKVWPEVPAELNEAFDELDLIPSNVFSKLSTAQEKSQKISPEGICSSDFPHFWGKGGQKGGKSSPVLKNLCTLIPYFSFFLSAQAVTCPLYLVTNHTSSSY